MKASSIVNACAHGLRMSNAHAHWADVNPIKRQTLTREEQRERARALDHNLEQQKRRLALRAASGSRILPSLV